MRRLLFLLGAWLWAGGTASRAPAPIPAGSIRSGTLSFDGRATLGDFTGSTTSVTGEMSGGATLAEVRGWVEAPVRTLVTGNGHRDRDLNKSMESEKYPVLRYDLTGVMPGERQGDSVAVTLFGSFLIHGVRQSAAIPAVVLFLGDGVRVRGETPLNLTRYQIGGLSKMLGVLKMHEDIVVHLDLFFGYARPGGMPLTPD